jgi:hypothetical protein
MSRWLFNLLFVLEVITIGILGVFLLYAVHCAFDRVCARHARRFCRRREHSSLAPEYKSEQMTRP